MLACVGVVDGSSGASRGSWSCADVSCLTSLPTSVHVPRNPCSPSWNRCSTWPESVFTFDWNRCSRSSGIRIFDTPARNRLELDTDLSGEPVSWVAQDQIDRLIHSHGY